MAGMPPGGDGNAFDMGNLQKVLEDPSIKQMAQQIANDPEFQKFAETLQQSMAGGAAAAAGEGSEVKKEGEGAKEGGAPANPMAAMMEAMRDMGGAGGANPMAAMMQGMSGMDAPGGAAGANPMAAMMEQMRNMGAGAGAGGAGGANPMAAMMEQMQAMGGGAGGAGGANPMAAMMEQMQAMQGGAGGAGGAGFDPSKYMEAMQGLLSNPDFVNMAEKLGQQILNSEPEIANMMKAAQNPAYKSQMEEKIKELKNDPELAPILEELETGGPMAMMKYWNDPSVLQKLNSAMFSGAAAPAGDAEGAEGEAAEEDDRTVHGAASSGNAELLKTLIAEGAALDDKDEEGRTALHFASGYGEMECVKLLLEASAKVDEVDNNKNTALHYAAGYGQADVVGVLMESSASVVAKNLDEKTPLEVAELNQQDDVVAKMKGVFTS